MTAIDPKRKFGLRQSGRSNRSDGSRRNLHVSAEQVGLLDHWITSSARSNTYCGIVRRSAFAVFMLITIANLVGCSIGRSAGVAPFRILST